MKKLYNLLLAPLAVMLWGCSENMIDNLSGTYDNIERHSYTAEQTGDTEKLRKGLKRLHMNFSDDKGNMLNLSVVSREWTLQPGVYHAVSSPDNEPAAMQFCGFTSTGGQANGAITEGDIDVNKIGSDFDITGLLTDNDGKRCVINYRGPIDFVIGVDDPEPSGYTVTLKIDPVTITDFSTWQSTVVPGVSKYTLSVSDPSGNAAAFFEAINTEGLEAEDLCGTYTIAGSPAQPWLIDNGWLNPAYGMAGGAYVVAPDGTKQYITNGKISIEKVTGINGETLFNFSGENLSYITISGASGSTGVGIRFVTLLEKHGTELFDLSFRSEVLDREVKYSVVLPKSFDGTKTFPVLYMLHGAGGSNNDWLNGGNIASHTGSVKNEMIIVSPQGSFEGFDAFYIDGYKGKGINYETFFFTEFMPAIDAMYKGNGQHGISGLSMGGFGSLYYGLKYPDKFSGIYACSPAIFMEGTPNLFDMIWTPGASSITVEIGTEDFLYEMNKAFNDAMQNSPLLPGFTYIERPGAHDWAFWSACSPKIIQFFDAQFTK